MTDSWVDLVEKKARIIHDQIASARSLALRNDIRTDKLERPYYDLLSQLYQEEFPLAQLIDSSDLVARFTGKSIAEGSAPTKIVASVVDGLRKQIQVMAKAIAGLNSDVPWPDRLDPLLTGLVKGSLVIGISIPSNGDGDADGQGFLALPDPVLDSVRDSMRRIAVVAQYVRSDHVDDSIEEEMPDPAVRDAVLVAASRLAPSTRSKVDELVLYEPTISDKDVMPLTAESRKVLLRAVAHAVKPGGDTATFSGTVRAIDLDARRFEIRHVREIDGGSIRCIYTDAEVKNERALLDREVRVHGRYEQVGGTPRLIRVIGLEVDTQTEYPVETTDG